jgi:hypothetical protein
VTQPGTTCNPARPAIRHDPQSGTTRNEEGIDVHDRPDLRIGDPMVHDLIAEIDEAIKNGDVPRMEELSRRLHRLDPCSGAGADT